MYYRGLFKIQYIEELKILENFLNSVQWLLDKVNSFLWGPATIFLLVGTGIFLTVRLKFSPWKNLFPSLKLLFSKESRKSDKNKKGDISPFSALMTALASTIGTGNIVGVATAMVAGGAGALVWMWIAALFGLSTKFSECALAIKYRVVNKNGEMLGGPMYSIKQAFKSNKIGNTLAILFAVFTVTASFGIGNMTQANSISDALFSTFNVSKWATGVILALLSLIIILGGIKSISKVSSVLVPFMAIFYIVGGLIVILGNLSTLPRGLRDIFVMAFSFKSVVGGACGTITATLFNSMRYGIGRGVFSNEAGMGSAAITASASQTDNHIKQGYLNMCGTFIDTIVICTITGLAIASSGVLGITSPVDEGRYTIDNNTMCISSHSISTDNSFVNTEYTYVADEKSFALTDKQGNTTRYIPCKSEKIATNTETDFDRELQNVKPIATKKYIQGTWQDEQGNNCKFSKGGKYEYSPLTTGVKLTIEAFRSVFGDVGGYMVSIGLVLFAFSTILGWEYHGEKALEFLAKSPAYSYVYKLVFSLAVYIGAVVSLDIVWSFSDIGNALMIIPNLLSLLLLSKVLATDCKKYKKNLIKNK